MNEIQDSPRLKSLRVLITGDACWDHYHYGEVTRISPEAPVPVFNFTHTRINAGMAANVNKNILNLCEHKNADHIFAVHFVEKKNRYIDKKFKQQLFRVDEQLTKDDQFKAFEKAKSAITELGVDLVIISDYNKGTLSYENIETLISLARVRNATVFIDTKKPDLKRFVGAYIKINESEYAARTSECPNIIVTRAEKGVIFYKDSMEAPRWFPVDPIEFVDVTGAGDTFLASVAFMYHITQDIGKSIMFANMASKITIQNRGCYAPTLKEILS